MDDFDALLKLFQANGLFLSDVDDVWPRSSFSAVALFEQTDLAFICAIGVNSASCIQYDH